MKEWRLKVFEKDGHKCVCCGATEKLETDHIKPFYKYPELRFDVNNGRILCRKCHMGVGWMLFKDENPRKNYQQFKSR